MDTSRFRGIRRCIAEPGIGVCHSAAMQSTVRPMSETVERRTPQVGTPLVVSSLNAEMLPALLSVIAASVDAISFLGPAGLFTAHVTGNLVILVAHLVTGNGARASAILAVP